MIVYRLCREAYKTDLSGKGAERYSGRWNSKGIPMLYTAESRALAILEVLVHVGTHSVPDGFFMLSISLPELGGVQTLDIKDLPADWNSNPFGRSTQQIGNLFIQEGNALVLKVPSTLVPEESNYLLNPKHSIMREVFVAGVEPFRWDPRLFRY